MKPNGIDKPQDTASSFGLIPVAQQMSFSKVLGIVIGILTVLTFVVGTPLWVVSKVEASALTKTAEIKATIGTHADTTHDKAVTKAVYAEHVKAADDRYKQILSKLDKQDGKLDRLLERNR